MEEFQNLNELLQYSVDLYNERILVREKINDRIIDYTYIDFHADVKRCAAYLHAKDVKGNVAILSNTSYYWMVLFFSILHVGETAVTIDKNLDIEKISEYVKMTDVTTVLYEEDMQMKIDKLSEIEELKCIRFITFKECKEYEVQIEEKYEVTIHSDDTALIVFSSGTTGECKGVQLSHRNLVKDTIYCDLLEGQDGNTVTMSILPPHHAFQITTCIIVSIYRGTTICIPDNIKTIITDMSLFQPKMIVAVPSVVEMMCKYLDRIQKQNGKVDDIFGGRLKKINCGGAFLRNKYIEQLNDVGITVCLGYGITECSPVVCKNLYSTYKVGSVGKILDPSLIEIKVEDGELLIKGSIVTKGYYKNKEATEQAFVGEWFKTGDLGYVDEEGYIYLVGRKKNIIILSNGENVSAEELENRINRSSLVQEVIVYAKTIGDNITVIAAEVYPDYAYCQAKNIQDVDKEINDYMKAINVELPSYKKIMDIKIRKEPFKKNAMGKIVRGNNRNI